MIQRFALSWFPVGLASFPVYSSSWLRSIAGGADSRKRSPKSAYMSPGSVMSSSGPLRFDSSFGEPAFSIAGAASGVGAPSGAALDGPGGSGVDRLSPHSVRSSPGALFHMSSSDAASPPRTYFLDVVSFRGQFVPAMHAPAPCAVPVSWFVSLFTLRRVFWRRTWGGLSNLSPDCVSSPPSLSPHCSAHRACTSLELVP